MEVESKVPVNESGDKKEEMTSADYYFDRYVDGFTDRRVFKIVFVRSQVLKFPLIPGYVQVSIFFRGFSKFFLKIGVSKFFWIKI